MLGVETAYLARFEVQSPGLNSLTCGGMQMLTLCAKPVLKNALAMSVA